MMFCRTNRRSSTSRARLVGGWRVGLVAVTISLALGGVAFAQPSTGALQSGAPVELNDGVPRELQDIAVEQNLGGEIPLDARLVDSLGRKVRLGDYVDGKMPLILTLNYSNCPMLCNVQLNQLAQSLDQMDLKIGVDFRMISVSIDPKETDERLRKTKAQYVEQVPSHAKADDGWAFTRTNEPTVQRIAKAVGFSYKYNPRTKEYAHPAMLAFISPDGVITRYSLGVAFPPDQMKLALVEAGQGTVGGVVDQFVLWCYSYDPAENSYVPQAWRIMRLGGGLTIALMALALVPYWRGRKGNPDESTGGANDPDQPSLGDPADQPMPLKPTQLI